MSGRRRRLPRRKPQRPSYVPRRCDQCHVECMFPSRTAFRNHLKWAHGLYLAHTGRYIPMGRPGASSRERAAPPAAESRPTPVPSRPVPSRSVLPATARVQPTPLMGRQFPASRAAAPRALMGIEAFPLVAAWRSQAARGPDFAMSLPAELARQPSPSPARDSDLESIGQMDCGSGAPVTGR